MSLDRSVMWHDVPFHETGRHAGATFPQKRLSHCYVTKTVVPAWLVGGMNTSTVTPHLSVAKPPGPPCERLEADIVELASQLTAASATLTRLIGEYDAAEGWREWGVRSTAHVLSWKCGMGLGAAREQRACRPPAAGAAGDRGRVRRRQVVLCQGAG